MRFPWIFKLFFVFLAVVLALIFASRRTESPIASDLTPGETAGDRLTITVEGVDFPFRWAPPGEFMMGSPTEEEGRDAAEVRHPVELTRGFWILETEVTQRMFESVTGTNPSEFQGDNLPVETVSWDDAAAFCDKWASFVRPPNGRIVALPTEAEWEYACRAGSTGAYPGPLSEIAWSGEPTESGSTHPVGTKKPNGWGLFDMTGNLWEWTADRWSDFTAEKRIDPVGPSDAPGTVRIDRGGCWDSRPEECRSAHRGVYEKERKSRFVGFRFVIR